MKRQRDRKKETMIHSTAQTDGAKIGAGTRVWQYSIILPGAKIGDDCNICAHVFIESRVNVGSRVTVKCGVQLWDGLTVADDVFIGPNATFTNDRWPRAGHKAFEFFPTEIQTGASVGANATILPGITIGEWAMVGAGAMVTRDVPPHALFVGAPAKRVGWVCVCGKRLQKSLACVCGRRFSLKSPSQINLLK